MGDTALAWECPVAEVVLENLRRGLAPLDGANPAVLRVHAVGLDVQVVHQRLKIVETQVRSPWGLRRWTLHALNVLEVAGELLLAVVVAALNVLVDCFFLTRLFLDRRFRGNTASRATGLRSADRPGPVTFFAVEGPSGSFGAYARVSLEPTSALTLDVQLGLGRDGSRQKLLVLGVELRDGLLVNSGLCLESLLLLLPRLLLHPVDGLDADAAVAPVAKSSVASLGPLFGCGGTKVPPGSLAPGPALSTTAGGDLVAVTFGVLGAAGVDGVAGGVAGAGMAAATSGCGVVGGGKGGAV